jgi:uncharacterized protein
MKPGFKSIHYPFAIDPTLGWLQQEPDYAAHVEQLIKQVLLTSPGERVNRPDFGCGLKRMLFAPNSLVAATLAQVSVFEALNRWLGSAIAVNDVRVEANNERLEVHIAYTLKVLQERRYLNLEVTLS